MRSRSLALVLTLCGASCALPLAGAEQAAARSREAADEGAADGDDWAFDLALYSWLTDITGEAALGDVRLDVEPQLWNDIVRNLDGALFGGIEARYQSRWILNLDLAYAKLSSEDEVGPFQIGFGPATIDRDLRTRRGRIPVQTRLGDLEVPVRLDPGTLRVDVPRVETQLGPFDVESSVTQLIVRGLVGYRTLDAPLPALLGGVQDDPRHVRIDLLAGVRYYYLKTEIDIEAPPVRVPPFEVSASLSGGSVRVGSGRLEATRSLGTIDLGSARFPGATLGGTDIDLASSDWWIDPVVGARAVVDVSEVLTFALVGNVGGFGIGSASDFSWETGLFGRYLLGEHWSFAAGYRALGFDRESGGLRLDLILHGPVLGFLYRF